MSKWDIVKDQLPAITKMAREGNSEKEIIKALGLSPTTFYKFKKEHIELADALHEGYVHSIQNVEAALYKAAIGYEYEEITQERDIKTGNMVITKKVKKEVQPNVSAIMNILKNKRTDEWNTVEKIDISGTIQQESSFQDLPSAKVSELAHLLLDEEE